MSKLLLSAGCGMIYICVSMCGGLYEGYQSSFLITL